jgi:hypothetical protein
MLVQPTCPEDGTYTLSGGGIKPLTAADFIGDPSDRTGWAVWKPSMMCAWCCARML